MKLFAPLLLIVLTLSGCGLRPLYGGGGSGAVAQTLGGIELAPIEGRAGWLVGNAIRDRVAGIPGSSPKYRLVIVLDDSIEGFGVRTDDAITRERRTLRARFQLVDIASGLQMLDETAGSDAGIDVVSSEYATIAAEDSALERLSQIVADQIITRVSLFAAREGAGQ